MTLAALRAIARIVPAQRREEWVAEWAGECAFIISRGATIAVLGRRLGAALAHATYLRLETLTMRDTMRDLWLDLVFGLRTLRRQPVLTLAVALTFALGIGANAAMYSVMRATLLKPLPLADQDRLVVAWQVSQSGGKGVFSYPDFQDWRSTSTMIDGAAAMAASDAAISGMGDADRVRARAVTPSFFPVTGVSIHGRAFADADTVPGSERVAIVTERFAARSGGRDPLGATFQMNGIPRRIVGVIPLDPVAALFPADAEVIVPLMMQPQVIGERGNRNYTVLAHLRKGATVDQANGELMRLMGVLGSRFPNTNAGRGGYVRTLRAELGAAAGRSVWLAGLVTVMVLLVACANIAGLLLARNAERRREFAVRTALGAGRWRIARQLLAESFVLASIGGAGALGLLAWSSAWLSTQLPSSLPRRADVHVDFMVIVVTFGVAALTAFLAGVPAAFAASSSRANAFGAHAHADRWRNVLVAGQLAVAVSLLVCVTLLAVSFVRLLRVDPGFSPDHLVTTQITIPRGYTAETATAFVDRVIAAVEAKPGVSRAGLFGPVPFSGFVNGWQVSSPGIDLQERVLADRYTTTAHAMALMGVTLLRGRMLEGADYTPAGAHHVVIDEMLARRVFGERDPIGLTIRLDENPPLTIVGVARHIRHYGFDERSRPQLYVSYAYDPVSWLNLVVRTHGDDAESVIRDMRRAVLEVDPAAAPYEAATVQTLIDRSVADRRAVAALAAALAGVTLLIAVAGLYGAMAFRVERRTKEIGVRVALGAARGTIARLVLGEALGVTIAGLAIGLPLAYAGARLISGFLFETRPFDAAIYASVALGAVVVAVMATLSPTRKATSIDPLRALRSE